MVLSCQILSRASMANYKTLQHKTPSSTGPEVDFSHWCAGLKKKKHFCGVSLYKKRNKTAPHELKALIQLQLKEHKLVRQQVWFCKGFSQLDRCSGPRKYQSSQTSSPGRGERWGRDFQNNESCKKAVPLFRVLWKMAVSLGERDLLHVHTETDSGSFSSAHQNETFMLS